MQPDRSGTTPGIFITGTNTGVGKTVVSTALVRLLAAQGRRVVGCKPVATGAGHTPSQTRLQNLDALELQAASPGTPPYSRVNPFCFEPAIAPHLAAAEAGVEMPLAALVDWYRTASAGMDVAIVEGAGGWRVPLYPDGFLSDLPEKLGLGVILVVGLTLGCLNHARLTAEVIAASGRCRWLGWIGNAIDPAFARRDANIATLTSLLGGPPLTLVPDIAHRPRSPRGTPLLDLGGEPRLNSTLQQFLAQAPPPPA